MAAHSCDPSAWKTRQDDHEFTIILYYLWSLRPARDAREPVSKTKQETQQQQQQKDVAKVWLNPNTFKGVRTGKNVPSKETSGNSGCTDFWAPEISIFLWKECFSRSPSMPGISASSKELFSFSPYTLTPTMMYLKPKQLKSNLFWQISWLLLRQQYS